MKIALVVQRYGADINGGAELHARYVAEHLAKHVHVEVLTTCASDYITWRNSVAEGTGEVHGITVRRFPVARERDPGEFGRLSEQVFTRRHALRDELAWLDAEGPNSPALIAYISAHESSFDFFIFFSFRYYHAYYGARAVPDKAILVPTAERDGALGLAVFPPVFRGVRAFMYNSFEERALIHAVSRNDHVPGVVVGVGSEIPAHSSAARFRRTFNLRDRFAVYVGRIDENKGCAELFDFFLRYTNMLSEGMHLVLIGNAVIPVPDHPKVHALGFVSDQDKYDAIAAAELLIMPSYLESLSMAALEAWAMGKPVLANGRCDVLRGQCVRSNGGLYYENFDEFVETLRAIDFNPGLAAALGRNGREYFNQHYSWPIVERKYMDMLERLAKEPTVVAMETLPSWFARRRRELPPAEEVVKQLPTGPALQAAEVSPKLASDPTRATPDLSRRSAPEYQVRATADATSSRRAAAEGGTSIPPSPAERRPQAASTSSSAGSRTQDRRDRVQGSRGDGRAPKAGPRGYRRRPGGRPPRRSGNR